MAELDDMAQIVYKQILDDISIALIAQDDGSAPMVVLSVLANPNPIRIAFAPDVIDFIATSMRDCERILYHTGIGPVVEIDENGLPHTPD